MAIKAVFFDMGGTIQTYRFDRNLRVRRAYLIRQCLRKGGIQLTLSDEQLADAITAGVKRYRKQMADACIELPPLEIWKDYIFHDQPISAETLAPIAEELSFIYETQLYERRLRPEMPDVLAQIKALGLKIGCISNVQSRGQVAYNLQEYGIIDYFDPIVLSSTYGRCKPDPSIFHRAARLAGVPASACVYVGDRINRDILGAKLAGYRFSVQIHHIYGDGQLSDENAIPRSVIHDMRELLPILRQAIKQEQQREAALADRPIKALLFDAGDILYYRPTSDPHLRAFLAQHAHPPQHDHIIEKSKALKSLAFIGGLTRRQFHTRLLALYGITDPSLAQAGFAAIERDEQLVEIIPGVPETLKTLKQQGYLLGVITDTALPLHMKLNWFARAGFGDVWDCFISSVDEGVHKPDPLIYRTAIQQLGLPASQCAFVGHRAYELDGARAVGMTTVAYNYEPEAAADFFVEKFSDLLALPFVTQYQREITS